MKPLRSLKLSLNSLKANKLRTFLALLGIAVGVAAMIIMVAIGRGAQQQVTQQIERMGTNLLTVKAGQVSKMINRERQYGDVTTLTNKDAEAIIRQLSNVAATAPVQDRSSRIKYGNISSMAEVVGSTHRLKKIRNYVVERGRFLFQDENRAGIRVAVIGNDVYKNLFKGQKAIGEIIRIDKIPFEVIGRLESIGAGPEGGNEDNRVIIPLRTAMRRVFNIRHLERIYVQVKNRSTMVETETQIRQLLRQRHGLELRDKSDDFTIHNQVTALEMGRQSSQAFTRLIAGISAIAMLVGGIGILAIMLLAVKERWVEIGLRRAIGARSKDIMFQFLGEALLLGLTGGGLGIFIGVATAWVIGNITSLSTVIPLQAMAISLLFSMTIGLFFGVYPARKAAMLDPIDALRSD